MARNSRGKRKGLLTKDTSVDVGGVRESDAPTVVSDIFPRLKACFFRLPFVSFFALFLPGRASRTLFVLFGAAPLNPAPYTYVPNFFAREPDFRWYDDQRG